jgi:hygromycin-B 7''-O-kinase
MRDAFPTVRTPEEFEAVRRDDGLFRPAVGALCGALGLGDAPIERFPDGSLPVYAVGGALVLKVFPPFEAAGLEAESAVLRAVEGRLSIPTPAVHAVGDHGGWGYLLMGRLGGVNLAAAWPQIPDADRLALASSLGRALAGLHATAGPSLATVHVDWPRFVAEQRRTAVERQRRRGLDERWLEQIPGFLDGTGLGEPRPGSLLHTEVMREHLLVERSAGGWRLSGLFDFEPAMIGAPEYEFAAVALFFSCGEPRLLRRVLAAYGYREEDLGADLEDRLLAYVLLHRYSNLRWYFERMPPGEGVSTLRALAAQWCGTGSRFTA